LELPLNDEVIKMMTRFNSKSPEAIKEQLTQIIESEAYQRSATQFKREHLLGEPHIARESSMKRIFGLSKKQNPSVSVTELDSVGNQGTKVSPQPDSFNAIDPLVSMYHLAHEKLNKRNEQG
jgi:hypothetical protein